MAKKKQAQPEYGYSRYALIGAGLGLYLGLFYRAPERELNFFTPLLLTVAVTVLLTLLYAVRKRPSLRSVAIRAVITFVTTIILLFVLETRLLLFDMGGKTAVTVFTVVMGVLSGLAFGYIQKSPGLLARNDKP